MDLHEAVLLHLRSDLRWPDHLRLGTFGFM